MKINLNKIISIILIIFFIVPSILFYSPQKAKAQYPVIDPANLKVNILNSTFLGTIAKSTTGQDLKEYVLDGIAGMFAKQIIRQITSSIVNWINSGFSGSPAFIQNPGAFFLDMADQITGDFLFKTNSPLSQLCSPFSIDIRLALAFKYHPNVQKRYTCTLGLIIKNTTNAVKNASINGFTAGDFRQGGWPAFVSLTTEPQNNIYGAYLQAESELSFRVANAQLQQKEELNQGRGFLSWKKCTTKPSTAQGPNEGTGEGTLSSEGANEGTGEGSGPVEKNCEIQTPGSVIEGALQNSLGGPLRELELADEINEIVNALFAQLVTQVLSAGLGGSSGVSGSGTSDLNSYINKINGDVSNTNTQISNVKTKLIEQVDNALKQTEPYKANKDASLNLFINVKSKYEIAKSCYVNRIDQMQKNPYYYNNSGYNQGSIPEYQSKIAEIDSIISTQITPTATRLLDGVKEADSRMQKLNEIKTSANSAKTLNDINLPSQKFSGMLQSGSLTNALDVQNSKDELAETQAKVSQFNMDAQRKLQECQVGY